MSQLTSHLGSLCHKKMYFVGRWIGFILRFPIEMNEKLGFLTLFEGSKT